MIQKSPIRVCVTGAAGQIGYALVPMIASGLMFGPDQPVILHLLEIPPAEKALKGVVLELDDGAYPLLAGVVPTVDTEAAFKDVDVAVLVGAFPRKQGMERKDLLKMNMNIFKSQGEAINKFASRNCKVLVVGNPANTNSLICKHFAPSIPAENFTCLTRLDHNRARSQIASRLRVPTEQVKNVIIWGNHSSTQYPDVNHAFLQKDNLGLNKVSVRSCVADDEWLNTEFIKTVQTRGAAIIAARGMSSALSASKAICDHVHDWVIGTAEGEWVSMGVPSDGSYGIKEGVIYSFPVKCSGGKYQIVQNLPIDEFSRRLMDATNKELCEERDDAFSQL